ncbi:hypothetical protein QMG83_15020 [Salinibacterium sp. G-O1]|nr:hypothetical protein [Salinibacterium sp. G-O1]MDJ0336538.1 hypothetical protein [Salinibacterium sp. G-O1]
MITFIVILAILVLVGITATVRELITDGYRRVPTCMNGVNRR